VSGGRHGRCGHMVIGQVEVVKRVVVEVVEVAEW
jgi:hypothetical protein